MIRPACVLPACEEDRSLLHSLCDGHFAALPGHIAQGLLSAQDCLHGKGPDAATHTTQAARADNYSAAMADVREALGVAT